MKQKKALLFLMITSLSLPSLAAKIRTLDLQGYTFPVYIGGIDGEFQWSTCAAYGSWITKLLTTQNKGFFIRVHSRCVPDSNGIATSLNLRQTVVTNLPRGTHTVQAFCTSALNYREIEATLPSLSSNDINVWSEFVGPAEGCPKEQPMAYEVRISF